MVLPLHQGSNNHSSNTNPAKKGGVAAKPMPSDFVACDLDVICNALKLQPGMIVLDTGSCIFGVEHHSAAAPRAVPQLHYCTLHLW